MIITSGDQNKGLDKHIPVRLEAYFMSIIMTNQHLHPTCTCGCGRLWLSHPLQGSSVPWRVQTSSFFQSSCWQRHPFDPVSLLMAWGTDCWVGWHKLESVAELGNHQSILMARGQDSHQICKVSHTHHRLKVKPRKSLRIEMPSPKWHNFMGLYKDICSYWSVLTSFPGTFPGTGRGETLGTSLGQY